METIILGPETDFRPSTLYCLEPIGVGTASVESLASLIARLAAEQSVTPWLLIREIISASEQMPVVRREDYAIILGTSETARKWVDRVQELTGSDGLAELTMLKWKNTISTKRLFRKSHAWCSSCYAEFAEAGTLYDPLLWSLSAVKRCPKHGTALLTECENCGRAIPFLQSRYRSGFCPCCGMPLFEHGREHGEDTGDPDELWAARQVEDLLNQSASWTVSPTLQGLMQAVEKYSPNQGHHAAAAAARVAGLRHLVPGETVSLPHLLQAAKLLGTSLACVLSGAPIVPDLEIASEAVCGTADTRQVESGAPVTPEYCESFLRSLLASGEEPFPSLVEIARRIGVGRNIVKKWCPELCRDVQNRRRASQESMKASYRKRLELILLDDNCPSVREVSKTLGVTYAWLYKWYGDLCHQISERHRRKVHQEAGQRHQVLVEVVRTIVAELAAQGLYPSAGRVQKEFAARGQTWGMDQLHKAWREAVEDWGQSSV